MYKIQKLIFKYKLGRLFQIGTIENKTMQV